MSKLVLILEGLDCANCAELIREETEKLPAVNEAKMNFMAKKLTVIHDGSEAKITADIAKIVKELEPDVKVKSEDDDEEENPSSFKFDIARIVAAIVLFAVFLILKVEGVPRAIGFLAAYIISGYDVILKALKNIIKGKIFDENFLMTIASVGAVAIGEFPEAVAVMVLYQIGELFQSMAVNRSRKSIADLMDIRPDRAVLLRDGEEKEVSPEEVEIGEIILVKAGEKIPLDGIITRGSSVLDTKALTGESLPRDCKEGDTVLSGSINVSGVLEIEVTKLFAESTAMKILNLVENAGDKKARAENFITKFAKYYTPFVVVCAVLIALIPPILGAGEFNDWIYRALTFLMISCPCALVISVPLSFFGGIGGASARGILIKGSNYLETFADCKSVVFDKTGTLTKGEFSVVKISPKEVSESELLKFAHMQKVTQITQFHSP